VLKKLNPPPNLRFLLVFTVSYVNNCGIIVCNAFYCSKTQAAERFFKEFDYLCIIKSETQNIIAL
jgi:hypothetical protein